jgi:hypothetical protein
MTESVGNNEINIYLFEGPIYTGYFMSDNDNLKCNPHYISEKSWLLKLKCPAFFENVT